MLSTKYRRNILRKLSIPEQELDELARNILSPPTPETERRYEKFWKDVIAKFMTEFDIKRALQQGNPKK